MGKLVEFPLDHGGTILVEVAEPETSSGDRPILRGHGGPEVIEQAEQTFQESIERVGPAAQILVGRLRALTEPPDELSIRFGLDLHAKAGAFIAEAGAAANFTVELTWHRS
jgi:hypothetical protein